MRFKFFSGLIVISVITFFFATPLAFATTNEYTAQVEVCPQSGCQTSFGRRESLLNQFLNQFLNQNNQQNASPARKTDVFDRLPFATSTEGFIRNLGLNNFSFIQVGEQNVVNGSVVRINGRKYLTISLPYNQISNVLKTIGVTIFDSNDQSKSLSFILKGDDSLRSYVATLAPLERAGLYPFTIHVLNYHDQQIKRIDGFLQVSGAGLIPVDTLASVFNNVVKPLVVTSGILAGASQLLAFSSVASIYDIYLVVLRGLGTFLGIRKKRKPWGTVYDSVTKRPVDPAYVTVYQNGKVVTSAITDIEGRYGFFLPAGTYQLVAQKTHYQFPSQFLVGKTDDELYDNLYFGAPFTTQEGEAVTHNIPMDPIGFDWNEFTKGGDVAFKKSFDRQIARGRFYRFLSLLGLVLAIGSVIFAPSVLNIVIVIVYLALTALARTGVNKLKLITVRRQITGEPIPFAIVRVYLAGINKEVKTLVADRYGRVYFLVRPGSYYLTVDRKQPDGSYYPFYKSEVKDLPNGVWPQDIVVSQFKEE